MISFTFVTLDPPDVEVSDDYLLGIGGDADNVFDIADFDQIDGEGDEGILGRTLS